MAIPSVCQIADLNLTNPETGEDQDCGAQGQQAGDSQPRWHGLRTDGEERPKAFCGYGYRAELFQVEHDAEFLQQRRQHTMKVFPHQNENRRQDRVSNEQAKSYEDRTIANAGQNGYSQVSGQMS